jgi:hypothetical protein
MIPSPEKKILWLVGVLKTKQTRFPPLFSLCVYIWYFAFLLLE